jgi:hypothetical protein
VATEETVRYYLALQGSSRPRTYLWGRSPEDPAERWYFEAVEDDGKLIPIRQLTVEADGTRLAYSPEHIDDGCGFLTDQPITHADELSICSADDFRAAWEAE